MTVCGFFFFFQAEDGIRDATVTGVQTCALPISRGLCRHRRSRSRRGPVGPPDRRLLAWPRERLGPEPRALQGQRHRRGADFGSSRLGDRAILAWLTPSSSLAQDATLSRSRSRVRIPPGSPRRSSSLARSRSMKSMVRRLQPVGRMTLALAALLVLGTLAVDARPVAAQSTERHSGTVVSVDTAARSLVMNELVQEGRPRQLVVRVPGGAPVVVSDRIPDEQVLRFDAVFVERSIDLSDVRPGDFVVIEGRARGDAAAAGKVIVTLRSTGSAPAAAPAARPRP